MRKEKGGGGGLGGWREGENVCKRDKDEERKDDDRECGTVIEKERGRREAEISMGEREKNEIAEGMGRENERQAWVVP